jgi:hypothetical protein
MEIPIALAFHTEELHDDRVWHRVEAVARWMTRKGLGATFFVYPFRAQVAGKDISDRVQLLAALGHEIGQHTHFYAGAKVAKHEKADDFSQANVVRCLRRDFRTLERMGCRPNGFAAGSWILNEVVLDTLAELGFVYDCSARFPKSVGMVDSLHHRWLQRPHQYASVGGNLLCLPTLCTLGEWFKWGRKVRVGGAVPYQLVCLHDYDLLSLRYVVPWYLLAAAKTNSLMSTGILASRLRK